MDALQDQTKIQSGIPLPREMLARGLQEDHKMMLISSCLDFYKRNIPLETLSGNGILKLLAPAETVPAGQVTWHKKESTVGDFYSQL